MSRHFAKYGGHFQSFDLLTFIELNYILHVAYSYWFKNECMVPKSTFRYHRIARDNIYVFQFPTPKERLEAQIIFHINENELAS